MCVKELQVSYRNALLLNYFSNVLYLPIYLPTFNRTKVQTPFDYFNLTFPFQAVEDSKKDGIAERLYSELPETSFTRSISNPEAVMRRRRQQILEQKLKQFCQEGGTDAGKSPHIS